jgi:hypothetical protein
MLAAAERQEAVSLFQPHRINRFSQEAPELFLLTTFEVMYNFVHWNPRGIPLLDPRGHAVSCQRAAE